jgi:hypothetical protein
MERARNLDWNQEIGCLENLQLVQQQTLRYKTKGTVIHTSQIDESS